jgi:ribosomal protein S18 acetylase RimI-like enzyme
MNGRKNDRPDFSVGEWRPDSLEAASLDSEIHMLAEILHAAVHGGAGVSFFVPFSLDEAHAFWVRQVLPHVRAGTRRVMVARSSGRIVGTVQLDLATPPNQRHRAAVTKLLVDPAARRRGIARALMLALEAVAGEAGRTLLTLDTVSGSPAEFLYRSLGYEVAGVIPHYARASVRAELEDATFLYKELRQSPGL